MYHVINDSSGKSVTVVSGDGQSSHTHRAFHFLNTCVRKDGGMTIWADGRPANETVRFNKNGKVIIRK
jgi:hypothetical protein